MHDPNENRPGYKKTKVGWIPTNWAPGRVQETGKVITGSTPSTDDPSNYSGQYLFAAPSDLGVRKYVTSTQTTLSQKGFDQCRKLPERSVLFVCIGSTIGKVGVAGTELATNQQINAIVSNGRGCSEYLYYILSHRSRYIASLAACQAVPIINKTEFEGILLPLPPLPEQEKIAAILSTWDAAIEQTRDLIEAKKKQKKSLMQQLLTGTRRLPGFNDKWVAKEVGSLFRVVSRPIAWDDDHTYRLLSVRRRSGGVFLREKLQGAAIKTKSMFLAHEGDFLISKMQVLHGATGLVPAELDKCHISGSYIVLRPRKEATIDRGFFARLSATQAFYHLTFVSSYGVHIEKMTFNLTWFLKSEVRVPPTLDEQRAIAAVLDTADAEISSLESKLEALEQQKKGLMQRLLTGQVRVKV